MARYELAKKTILLIVKRKSCKKVFTNRSTAIETRTLTTPSLDFFLLRRLKVQRKLKIPMDYSMLRVEPIFGFTSMYTTWPLILSVSAAIGIITRVSLDFYGVSLHVQERSRKFSRESRLRYVIGINFNRKTRFVTEAYYSKFLLKLIDKFY